ncbi:hypothetical protein AB0K93_09190 [Streptomyces sp. NPDC052676]|uniref:hypothetical protein n=1 Tax=Streptomyces sp. NPDC052676 TaxID=3154953 RepID=UPI003412A2E2
MKLRHVRAVAVFVGVVVALTGARHSGGGGCDSSNSSSSSGSSGGSSTYDDDDSGSGSGYDSGYDSGTGSGGATSDTGSGGGSVDASRDVRIEDCVHDATRGIVARVSASNPSSTLTYSYEFSVTFKDPEGTVLRTSESTIPYVSPGDTETLDVAASYVPAAGGDGSGGRCELDDVTRTAV